MNILLPSMSLQDSKVKIESSTPLLRVRSLPARPHRAAGQWLWLVGGDFGVVIRYILRRNCVSSGHQSGY